MDAAAGHIDGFNLARRGGPDGVVVAFTNLIIVFHNFPEGRERQYVGSHIRVDARRRPLSLPLLSGTTSCCEVRPELSTHATPSARTFLAVDCIVGFS